MNLLSRNQKGSMRRTREALSVFVVMLFGLVCVGSARAQDVSRYAYVPNANGISIYTVDCQDGPTSEQTPTALASGAPRRCAEREWNFPVHSGLSRLATCGATATCSRDRASALRRWTLPKDSFTLSDPPLSGPIPSRLSRSMPAQAA